MVLTMRKFFIVFVVFFLAIAFVYFYFFRETSIDETVVEEIVPGKDTAVVAENLQIPWELAFLPDGTILVTERPGNVAVVREGSFSRISIPDVYHVGEGGLLGMALHPDFGENKFLYFYLTYKEGSEIKNRVERYRFDNNALSDRRVIVDEIPGSGNHNGGRIAFGPDGYLYITTGDSQTPSLSQDINSLAGKILRLLPDGSIPDDNPFGNAVYTFGHRNAQGLAWDNEGRLWSTEHGPSSLFLPNCCQDELNLIERGKNYGWPDSRGDNVQPGTVGPVLHSKEDTWAPAGVVYHEDSLFFGGLRGQTLYEAVLQGDKVIELKKHFQGEFGRVRVVSLGQENFLYISTSNTDGRGSPRQNDDKIIRIITDLLSR